MQRELTEQSWSRIEVQNPRQLGIREYGLLGSSILLLVSIPAVLLHAWDGGGWHWFAPTGLPIRTMPPPTLMAGPLEAYPIITVQPAKGRHLSSHAVQLQLNSRPVSSDALPDALRAELSRRADSIVYVDGDRSLDIGDVLRVVDIARGAWPDVTIVLLTPKLKRDFNAAPFGARVTTKSAAPDRETAYKPSSPRPAAAPAR
jgi:hypothetical protein